jgi:hypothetical protein
MRFPGIRVGFRGGLAREPRLPLTEDNEQILDRAMRQLTPVPAAA